jgi:hypothetical protein
MPAINSRSERRSVQLAELNLLLAAVRGSPTPRSASQMSNGAVSNRYSIIAGPGVRIQFPPAASPQTLGPSMWRKAPVR